MGATAAAHAAGLKCLPHFVTTYRRLRTSMLTVIVGSIVSTICLVGVIHSGTLTPYNDAYTPSLRNGYSENLPLQARTTASRIADGLSVRESNEILPDENHAAKQRVSAGNNGHVEPCALLISSSARSVTSHNARIWLESFRIAVVEKIVSSHADVDLGPLTKQSAGHIEQESDIVYVGRYSLIVMDDMSVYMRDFSGRKGNTAWQKALDKYCVEYDVGQVLFPGRFTTETKVMKNFGWPFAARPIAGLTHAAIASDTARDFLYVAKPGGAVRLPDHKTLTLVFTPFHRTYAAAAVMWRDRHVPVSLPAGAPSAEPERYYTTVLVDKGLRDGVRRVMFGRGLFFWLHKLLFLDAMRYLTLRHRAHPRPHSFGDFGLQRHVTIDIDDVFGAVETQHMHTSDVAALLDLQSNLSKSISNFKFQLGFVAGRYKQGSEDDVDGDGALMAASRHFLWFDHSYQHYESRWFQTDAELEAEMRKSEKFAKDRHLKIVEGYAVSPRHSGVYPVDPRLFRVWRKVWNVSVTTTEEYPHLKPASQRRGFVFQNTRVVPRQTCGLFTTTNYWESFPGGEKRLATFVEGGELFLTILRNPVSFFMTHANNYANDRLAPVVFTRLVKFIETWTNLRLRWDPPSQVAEKYFSLFPEDKRVAWENPCSDERHLATWTRKEAGCLEFPSFLVIGGAGSARPIGALVVMVQFSEAPGVKERPVFLGCPGNRTASAPGFAGLHAPTVGCHRNQWDSTFFSSNVSYGKSIEWYLNRLSRDHGDRLRVSGSLPVIGDASTSYFTSDLAPPRASLLLPDARVVVVLASVSDEVVRCFLGEDRSDQRSVAAPAAVRWPGLKRIGVDATLQARLHRCMALSDYSVHLASWLRHYPENKVTVVDGEHVISAPQSSLEGVRAAVFNQTFSADTDRGYRWVASSNHSQLCLEWKHSKLPAPCYSLYSVAREPKLASRRASNLPRGGAARPVTSSVSSAQLREGSQDLQQHGEFQELLKRLREFLDARHGRLHLVGDFDWLPKS